jgi:hypothetical protein
MGLRAVKIEQNIGQMESRIALEVEGLPNSTWNRFSIGLSRLDLQLPSRAGWCWSDNRIDFLICGPKAWQQLFKGCTIQSGHCAHEPVVFVDPLDIEHNAATG